jgi:hypothetical protein
LSRFANQFMVICLLGKLAPELLGAFTSGTLVLTDRNFLGFRHGREACGNRGGSVVVGQIGLPQGFQTLRLAC